MSWNWSQFLKSYIHKMLNHLNLSKLWNGVLFVNLQWWFFVKLLLYHLWLSFTIKLGNIQTNYLFLTEFIWRCVLRKQLEKLLAIILGCMSAALLLAEATILPNGVDLSLFSILINSVGKQEMLVQVIYWNKLDYLESQMSKLLGAQA